MVDGMADGQIVDGHMQGWIIVDAPADWQIVDGTR